MTTAALDPSAAIAAAGEELLGQLRDLVTRHDGDTDVPGLLDELTTLIRRARGKVGRAQKRAAAAAAPGNERTGKKPSVPAAAPPVASPAKPSAAPNSHAPNRPPTPRTVPTAATPRVTVPISRPVRPPSPATASRTPLPRWVLLVALVLAVVLGAAVSVASSSPLGIVGAAAAITVGVLCVRRRAKTGQIQDS